MPDNLLGRIGDLLQRRPWYELPRLLSMPRLIEMRNTLREKNLHDTAGAAVRERGDPDRLLTRGFATSGQWRAPTTICTFQRWAASVPASAATSRSNSVFPATADLLTPSPRLVSRELMTREEFKPATVLNLMAASWIQFMVHDWFVHKTTRA